MEEQTTAPAKYLIERVLVNVMSWISTFMKSRRPQRKRNSMRTLEDLYDAKVIDVDGYVELKSSLLSGEFGDFHKTLATIVRNAPTKSTALLADLEALYVKAQQLAQYKEQVSLMKQNGGDEDDDEDDEEGEEEEEDEDDEDEGQDGAEPYQGGEEAYQDGNGFNTQGPSNMTGGGRFASAWGPDYSPRYKKRSFRR